MAARFTTITVLLCTVYAHAPTSAWASLISLEASGTISSNTSGDATIPAGTPWTLQLIYDTAAPDLDFESTGSPDPTFGKYKNTASPPALHFFHYQAGGYAVTIDDAADFGQFSEAIITATAINAIDVNIRDSAFFPPLAGGAVTFHADFNRFTSPPIFSNDGLPNNTALNAASFDQSAVSLLPAAGGEVSSGVLTSLTISAVPEPAAVSDVFCVLAAGGALTLLRRFR